MMKYLADRMIIAIFALKFNLGMKKAISISFILLANIVIFAHAVVPHHHHNRVFAAIVTVLDDDARILFNHSHNAESHHHDTDSEDCAIYESVAGAVARLQKDNSQDHGTISFEFQPDLFVVDIANIWDADPFVKNLSVLPTPYMVGAGLDYYARALGLRAPPAC